VQTVNIVVEVEDGIAIITNVAAPPGLTVRVVIRDYDTDGSDPEDVDADEKGVPCFESTAEYFTLPEQPGFI